ncbi:putative 2OG-Fe(II) oxygenase [Halochromatium glycolicum]|jgi:hypothetical protein|uniref:Fe2OG dioxygenase domain-containing protein n=1 Tax=Halochromatium glycolicum TaxID=85075 RepID=A0AAJ0U826_9GAMM|nr:putative 2OG-Fe(II) oxygenase [Halochromatium glycolicum]MBK1706525.1 hypothetical protein [Halochromatium glycolicum]
MQAHLSSSIIACRHPDAETINPRLIAAFDQLGEADFERRSHFIGGRFENLYLKPGRLPGVEQILQFALEQVRDLLRTHQANWLDPGTDSEQALRIGFWLNAMQPGQTTSRHHHEEHDELFSGVYYVSAPEQAGDILFHDPPFETRVSPQPGMTLLFPPALEHSVETNRSSTQRLSIAFNIGPD